jgi:hypothetical protein
LCIDEAFVRVFSLLSVFSFASHPVHLALQDLIGFRDSLQNRESAASVDLEMCINVQTSSEIFFVQIYLKDIILSKYEEKKIKMMIRRTFVYSDIQTTRIMMKMQSVKYILRFIYRNM